MDLRPLTAENYPQLGLSHLVAAVMDASAIGSDVAYSARDGGTQTRLAFALRLGALRLFIPEEQRDEPIHAACRQAERHGVPPTMVKETWDEHYAPYVRFVVTGTHDIDDPRVEALAARDPSDLATARLVARLAPVASISRDKDLLELGLAHDFGNQRSALVTTGYSTGSAPMDLFGMSAYAIGSAGVAATRGVRRRPAVGAAVVGLALVSLGLVRWTRADLRFGRWLRTRGQMIVDSLSRSVALREWALEELRHMVVGRETAFDLPDLVMRRLAVAGWPLNVSELVDDLATSDASPSPRAVLNVLRADPCFVRVDDGWQLGTAAA